MQNDVILCIDDEKVVLNGLQTQLEREFGAEYTIELAESGQEALELVQELLAAEKNIPIVISDELMPGMRGHEILSEIHKISPATYKILLTGHSDFDAVIYAINHANLYRYMSKPWEGYDLVITVKEALKSFYQTKQLEELKKLLEIHSHLFSLLK